jgi:uncharacterized membrane protein
MKRFPGFLAALFVGFALFLPRFVFAEVIRDFRVEAELDSERNLTIVETITYDFENEERHGIYRSIPVRYSRDGRHYNLHLRDIEARMDEAPVEMDVSTEGDRIKIKIGDSDKTITGPHVYTIRYATDRAVNFFEDHSELYWNVTGDEWPAIIEQSSFSLKLPSSILKYPPRVACYTGPYGSPAAECETLSFERLVTFKATRALLPGEGFTVVAGMPTGVIRAPSASEHVAEAVSDNWIFSVPFIVFAIMYALWWKIGRDPELRAVIPEYEAPDNLKPHEVVAAWENGKVPSRGITAAVIDLARKGYLHIRFGEKKGIFTNTKTYTLVKMKDSEDLDPALKELFDGLFASGEEIRVDEFRDKKIYSVAAAFRTIVEKDIEKHSYFARTWYNGIGVYLVVGINMMWLSFLLSGGTLLGTAAVFVSGLIVVIFGFVMPKRTLAGTEILRKVKGFQMFMSVAEKDRISFHNAPKQTPQQFLELLPYAIALGVEKEWAEQFKDIDIKPPEWAEGEAFQVNWMSSLVRDIGSLSASAAVGFSPPSSAGSGGSGFSGGGSGGGFGGGGGGSW